MIYRKITSNFTFLAKKSIHVQSMHTSSGQGHANQPK